MSIKTTMMIFALSPIFTAVGGSLSMLVGNAVFRHFHYPFLEDVDAAYSGLVGGFIAGVVSFFLYIYAAHFRCEREGWTEPLNGIMHFFPGFLLSGPIGYATWRDPCFHGVGVGYKFSHLHGSMLRCGWES
ncbi:hypothetical protein BD410DRAFT_579964 [Rickenella mellea]|uniref:Uncharacterized protein n=1 Tax=Rickenella mellea TaxID=50990 RepID=A0A4Y7PP53_9AGAM|nr:hypothetical protein BD410DRAFT_579964 [Rickenella mellea]